MCLKHSNAKRVHISIVISPAQCFGLASGTWSINTFEFPVTRSSNPFYNCINAVSVPLGIFQTFENDHSHSFTNHHSARIFIEGLWVFVFRESRCFTETHVHHGRIVRINTTRNHHVCTIFQQITYSHFHSTK